MEGINITPELIEKVKAIQSHQELMELCKGEGMEINEEAAEKWFAKLNSGELAVKLRSPAANGGCGGVTCPQCGSSDYSQTFISFHWGGAGVIHCHCNSCGYTRDVDV